jgi:hypothetical protein
MVKIDVKIKYDKYLGMDGVVIWAESEQSTTQRAVVPSFALPLNFSPVWDNLFQVSFFRNLDSLKYSCEENLLSK